MDILQFPYSITYWSPKVSKHCYLLTPCSVHAVLLNDILQCSHSVTYWRPAVVIQCCLLKSYTIHTVLILDVLQCPYSVTYWHPTISIVLLIDVLQCPYIVTYWQHTLLRIGALQCPYSVIYWSLAMSIHCKCYLLEFSSVCTVLLIKCPSYNSPYQGRDIDPFLSLVCGVDTATVLLVSIQSLGVPVRLNTSCISVHMPKVLYFPDLSPLHN